MDNNTGTKKRTLAKPIQYGLVIIAASICVCCSIFAFISSGDKTTQQPTQEVVIAVSSPVVSQQNSPEPTVQPSAVLPGLYPADVTVNLEQRGFTCSDVEKGTLYYSRLCKRDESSLLNMAVIIYGSEITTVDLIESVVLQLENPLPDLAIPFLGFMATMPYIGAVPDQARAWVEQEIPTINDAKKESTTEIAGVSYRLYGSMSALTLEMGYLK